MSRRFLTVFAALALAACADAGPTEPSARPEPPAGPLLSSSSTQYTIFTTQMPESTLDASGGWEVATRFYTTAQGCVTGLGFWRADGETGINTIKLWTHSGTLLAEGHVYGGSGWQYVYLSGFVCLDTYTYYRVSVNTNSWQVKTFGAFYNGPIANGPLVADGGYYGQPIRVMPTNFSYSNFFVDVVFDTGFTY